MINIFISRNFQWQQFSRTFGGWFISVIRAWKILFKDAVLNLDPC